MESIAVSLLTSNDLLRFGLPLSVFFLSAWLILRMWMIWSGLGSTGFSPAITAALFAPVLFVLFLMAMQAMVIRHTVSAHVFSALIHLLLFAPTFLLLLPAGIASIVMARRTKPIPNWKLWIVLATWFLLSWGLLAVVFSQGH